METQDAQTPEREWRPTRPRPPENPPPFPDDRVPGYPWNISRGTWTEPVGSWETTVPVPESGHSPRHYLLAGSLFLATIASTMVTWGWAYSATVMTILLSHEMGHYLMCRKYRVRSTLPLFVPMPMISPFGTMGAVILMRQRIRDRKVLFDIGIAGPLAGLIPAVLAVAWGLAHSKIVPNIPSAGLRLGDSLLFAALEKVLYPSMSASQELMLHPVAYAGWAGLFVTALNLLPIGQLDGGHVINGILGRRSFYVSWVALGGLAVLAVFYPQWWVLVGLLLLLLTRGRRVLQDDRIPLDRRRVALGIFAFVIFIVSFTPRPFLVP